MVICAKALRLFSPFAVLLIISRFTLRAECQAMVKGRTSFANATTTEIQPGWKKKPPEDATGNGAFDINNDDGQGNYESDAIPDPLHEDFYCDCDDVPDEVIKERRYGRLLIFGSGALLLVGLCGFICLSRKRKQKEISENTSTCDFCDRRYFSDTSCEEDDGCIVNIMHASPDLSESESTFHHMPLPLIYDDMGKICNNAEMFIQRCMTSSVKRTYSEPVKNVVSSRTKLRDYVKELAYLRDKERQDIQKHGAVRAFFNDMFKAIKKTTMEKSNKQSKVKVGDSSNNTKSKRRSDKRKSKSKGKLSRKTHEKEASTSVSITSLLLKPQYQAYYKKNVTPDKTRRVEIDMKKQHYKGDINDDAEPISLLPKDAYQNKHEYAETRRIEVHENKTDIPIRDTEELINFCVNTLKKPINRKFITLLDTINIEEFKGLQDVAGRMAKNLAVEHYLGKTAQADTRGGPSQDIHERVSTMTSISRDMSPTKTCAATSTIRTVDTPVRTNVEEDERSKMREQYIELQRELEKLNESMKKFAAEFVYSENVPSDVTLTPSGELQMNP